MRSFLGFSNDADLDDDYEYEEEDEMELSEPTAAEGSDQGKGTCAALKKMAKSPIAALLVFSPISLVLWKIGTATGKGDMLKGDISPLFHFICNFLAVVPLAWVISECTEHLEKKLGPMLGTLLNCTFGNVVEIILSITAISQGKVKLVQSTLLGAMLMNCSGVLGLVFLVAGLNFHRKKFNQFQATYNLAMLAVSALALAVPTSLAVFDNFSTTAERLALSRWVAFCLLLMYVQWNTFNLCTHAALFDKKANQNTHWFWAHGKEVSSDVSVRPISVKKDKSYAKVEDQERPKERSSSQQLLSDSDSDSDDDDEPEMAATCACILLAFSTVMVSFHCDWLVESIDPVCDEFKVKKSFISTVLLPIVGNFSEVIASVSIACKGKLDLAMGVAIGSATQIALCVIPVAVFIAAFFDQPLDLDFETYQVKVLVLVILVATLVVLDGEANWLKGSLMMTAYVIIVSSFWFIHDREYKLAGEEPSAEIYLTGSNRSLLEM